MFFDPGIPRPVGRGGAVERVDIARGLLVNVPVVAVERTIRNTKQRRASILRTWIRWSRRRGSPIV